MLCELRIKSQNGSLPATVFLIILSHMTHRGRTGDIIFEFSLPQEAKYALILCDGLPSVPKQKELIAFLISKNIAVFYPRYKGTWESGGTFLAESPARDIAELATLIKQGNVTELYSQKTFKLKGPIHALGSSFGGSVALALADNKDISKIVALSPIIDFKSHNDNNNEQDLYALKNFIHDAFGFGYRFDEQSWDELLQGKVFNPPQTIDSERANDIAVAYGISDTEIDYKKITGYASRNSIRSFSTENIGHLSFSKIPESLWEKILSFLD